MWVDSPVLPKRLTTQSEELRGDFAPREWTDQDRFLKTQSFLHDKLMGRNRLMKFEGAHGLWELCVQHQHHHLLSDEVRDTPRPAPPAEHARARFHEER